MSYERFVTRVIYKNTPILKKFTNLHRSNFKITNLHRFRHFLQNYTVFKKADENHDNMVNETCRLMKKCCILHQ